MTNYADTILTRASTSRPVYRTIYAYLQHDRLPLPIEITMTTYGLRKAARIILIGAPGVGKGTQTERLLKRFPQLSAISSGDLLRDNVRNRTPLGTHEFTLSHCM